VTSSQMFHPSGPAESVLVLEVSSSTIAAEHTIVPAPSNTRSGFPSWADKPTAGRPIDAASCSSRADPLQDAAVAFAALNLAIDQRPRPAGTGCAPAPMIEGP